MTIREFFKTFDYDWEEEGRIEVFICQDKWVNQGGHLECSLIVDDAGELEFYILDDYGDWEFTTWTSYLKYSRGTDDRDYLNNSMHLVIGFVAPSIE